MTLSQFSQSQNSQASLPNAQRLPATHEDLIIQVKDYLSKLITRNNQNDADQGVLKVLELLDKENPTKLIKSSKILKHEIVATLGFLNYLSYETASETYKKILVDNLITEVVKKFNLLKPEICNGCSQIYHPDELLTGDSCFVCTKSLCPNCCPKYPENDLINKVYFAVCTSCSPNKREPTQHRIQTPETHRTEDLRNDDPPENKSDKVCSFYTRRSCRNKQNPEACKYQHPKLCFQWMKQGRCRDTEKCKDYHHPKLCHSIRKNEDCTKEKCRAVHLWTKGKTKPKEQPLIPPQAPQIQPIVQPPPNLQPIPYAQVVSQPQPIVTQQQPQGFQPNPPRTPPPDPIQELRNMVLTLSQKVDLMSQRFQPQYLSPQV